MNIFDLPPIAAILAVSADALAALGGLVTPAGAVVLVTLAVRAVLIPVGISVAKAAQGRRRIAPRLAELQKRYRKRPEQLQKATLELYASEKVSPLSGCLPMLAQAPVISLVYALFASATIAGAPNHLLDASLLGAGLGRHLIDLGSGFQPSDLVFVALLVVIGVVAWLNRRMALRDAAPTLATEVPGAALLSPRGPLGWAPFLTLVAAAFVPLAATLYLAVSGVWSYTERRVLRSVYA
ncbi:YidC/Oxa1 family membrane protein insertase [Protaetiibacter mangrovi]|uniref:Membrane protein insertase YidC n=1 Tax=Protaetiibacter mangrovi TaxID=2970926 RepID=A0ABT1ZEA2_9MICO|nr:YidC/Oxa1 family membrane protein insertase [Protaetiibacter mangrovi]MCS0499034.1 YidC/Oxa1 family membrane protein insertase [Protaetiibacter mangrovi]TPX05341.1 YidC/Oxa1 family membrane protein insertase [Schumannella luteola]